MIISAELFPIHVFVYSNLPIVPNYLLDPVYALTRNDTFRSNFTGVILDRLTTFMEALKPLKH